MKRPVTMVAWRYAPERLSLPEAAAPSGLDPALLESLIIKESLREYLETALEVAQGLWG